MAILPAYCRVAVCTVTLLFSVFPYGFARGGRTNSPQLDAGAGTPEDDTRPQVCDAELQLKPNRASRTLQFQCPEGSKLRPVEGDPVPTRELTSEELENVYVVTTATGRSKPACTANKENLKRLVPGSTLEVVTAKEKEVRQKEAPPVFQLTLGAAQSDEKQFCYTCSPSGTAGRGTPTGTCNIFVTVPKADEQTDAGTNENQHSDQGSDQVPHPTPDDQEDKPTGSGSFSSSLSCWLVLGVAACASGFGVHLHSS